MSGWIGGGRLDSQMGLGRRRLRGDCADIDQVVGEDSMSGPDPGALSVFDAGAVRAVAAFEGADAAFTAFAPLEGSPKRGKVFGSSSSLGGFAFAGYDDGRAGRPRRVSLRTRDRR